MGDGRNAQPWPASSKSCRACAAGRGNLAPGAAPVRAHARSQRRAQDPYHPRLLREAVAALPARSGRHAAFLGARRARADEHAAGPLSTRRLPAPPTTARSPLGKALATVMAFTSGDYVRQVVETVIGQARRACQDGRLSCRPRGLGRGRMRGAEAPVRCWRGDRRRPARETRLRARAMPISMPALPPARPSVQRPISTKRSKLVFDGHKRAKARPASRRLRTCSSHRMESR